MTSDRFNDLLPWYVNGTLNAADREWVERQLAEHPDAREELEWYRTLQTQVRQDTPAVPASIGLAKVLHLIRGDRPTLAEQFTAFFAAFGMRPVLALAGVAAMAVQGGVILNLLQGERDQGVELRAIHTRPSAAGPLLELSFAAGAKEAEIRLLLVSVQGSLAGGPGPAGEYYIRVPAGQEAASLARLAAQADVRAVSLVPGLPESPKRP
jgi:hypothetical protein